MSIIIQNISPEGTALTGPNRYRVRVNQTVICEFEHDRQAHGLAQCLRDAADAVEASRNRRLAEMLSNKVALLSNNALTEQIRRLIVRDDTNGLGAAIEWAAEVLPEGYWLRLDIEKDGCSARLVSPGDILVSPDDIVADVDRDTLVDEIEALVEIAIKRSTEPKPLTREQLHYQRMAD